MAFDWADAISHFACWKARLAELDTSGQQLFLRQRRPVSPEKVAEAEQHVGTRFPQDYKDFLRHMDGLRGFSNLADLFGATDILEGKADALRKLPQVMDFLAIYHLRDEDVVPIGTDTEHKEILFLFSPTSHRHPGGVYNLYADGRYASGRTFTKFFTDLDVTTQKGVDLNFTSVDLTLSLDDFSKRILQPAMSVLAANIEADALSMMGDVYNNVGNIGSAITMAKLLAGRKALNDNLTPLDNRRRALLNTRDNADLVDALKGLFQDSDAISEQYKEGMMGRTAGFDFYENTLIPTQATGTDATNCTVNGASQTGSTVTIANASTKTFKKGDVVTLAGCFRVHPETKAVTSDLQPFVVTADVTAGGTALPISPAIVTSGGTQNVSASPTNGGAVTKTGGASAVLNQSLLFHEDAFTFATADLQMPQGVDFSARQVLDGISMRIVRQYDINNDRFILYKERSMYAMTYVGAPYIFRFQRLPGESGILARGCVVDTPLGHVVLTAGDVVLNAGQGAVSIANAQVRNFIFTSINTALYQRAFVCKNPQKNEVWVCFPTADSTVCNQAMVWNWVDRSWALRTLANATYGAHGQVPAGTGSDTWASDGNPWDTDDSAWTENEYSPAEARLLMTHSAPKVSLVDSGTLDLGLPITAVLERTGMPLGGANGVKTVTNVLPRIDGPTGQVVQVQVGASMLPDAPPVYGAPVSFTVGSDRQVDCFATGRFMAIKFSSAAYPRWRMRSFDVVYDEAGLY